MVVVLSSEDVRPTATRAITRMHIDPGERCPAQAPLSCSPGEPGHERRPDDQVPAGAEPDLASDTDMCSRMVGSVSQESGYE